MGKKQKTDEEFKAQMKELHPNIEVLGIYTTSGTKLPLLCLDCGSIWEATPNNLLSKKSCCPVCAAKLRGKKGRKSDEKFREQLIQKNSNLIPIEAYITSKTAIYSICKFCKSLVYATPQAMLRDAICCPDCVRKYKSELYRKADEQFRQELKKKHPNLTALEPYVDAKFKISVLCNDCSNVWKVAPGQLLYAGGGCPVCVKYSMEKPVMEALSSKKVCFHYNFPLIGSNYNGSSRPLFLDFLIETEKGKLVIETDGKQHFIHVKDKEPLEEIQARDRHKLQ